MLKYLKSALDWSWKWFGGSSGGALATMFGIQTIADKEFSLKIPGTWSIIGGITVFFITLLARFIFILIDTINQLESQTSKDEAEIKRLTVESGQKQQEIEKFIKSKPKLYDRSRGDYHIYGKDIIFLKIAFSHIHRLRKEAPIGKDDIDLALSVLCEALKNVFEEGVDKKYTVSIKLFEKDPEKNTSYEDLKVKVFYGDKASIKDRESHYNKSSTLKNESCFKPFIDALSLGAFYFLENNVIQSAAYKTSYFESYPFPDGTTIDQRIEKWKVPYRSELVVPICPVHSKELPLNRRYEVLGFLCVDCDQTGGFHPQYDPEMLEGVVDGIYDLIPLVKNLYQQTRVDIKG